MPAPELELGDARSTFDVFFAAEYRSVVGLAAVLSGHRSVAEELAQEAFVAAFRRWDVVARYDDPGAWVRRVVANKATSAWRSRVREGAALARLRSRREAGGELNALDAEFWVAVRRLPRRQAQCVALHYLEDRPVQEIATVLGIASSTVRVHLHQGRAEVGPGFGAAWEGKNGGPSRIVLVEDFALIVHLPSRSACPAPPDLYSSIEGVPVFFIVDR